MFTVDQINWAMFECSSINAIGPKWDTKTIRPEWAAL